MGRAIRTERYRLVEWKQIGAARETAEFELYDYVEGPVEYHNIANENPEVVEQLLEILSQQPRSEEHTSELQSRGHLVCRLLLEKKKKIKDREQTMYKYQKASNT